MKVMCAPQKISGDMTQSAQGILKENPRVVGLTEMDAGRKVHIPEMLTVLLKFTWFINNTKGNHSNEVPLLVRLAPFICKVTKAETYFLAPELPDDPNGFGNDRWVTIIWLRWFGRTWAIANTHLYAGVQNTKEKPYNIHEQGPRTPGYQKSITRLERLFEEILADPDVGGRLIVMGDFNVLAMGEGLTWFYSPVQLFKRLEMNWTDERVVYLAWGPGLQFTSHEVIPPKSPQNPADHAWIVGIFKRVKGKR